VIDNFTPIEKRIDAGAIVENFVFLSLKNMFPEQTINYWRTIAKAEVDFVLRLNEKIIPIEVKYQTLKKPKISRSFRSFIDSYKPDRALVITKDFWGKIKLGKTVILFVPACYL
jgi:hypothetical protein